MGLLGMIGKIAGGAIGGPIGSLAGGIIGGELDGTDKKDKTQSQSQDLGIGNLLNGSGGGDSLGGLAKLATSIFDM